MALNEWCLSVLQLCPGWKAAGCFPVLQGPLVLGTPLEPGEMALREKEGSRVRASAFLLGL